ncbi:MAG: his Kinase domain protein [Acidobacteria bacterium]|nr:his Kinase domain protein [Acidobacteriota bacterium]
MNLFWHKEIRFVEKQVNIQKGNSVARGYHFTIIKSLRNKLLTLMILLSLVPLAGMSAFSYFIGSSQLEESITFSLEKMAQDTADKIDLMLRQKKEDVQSMAAILPLIYPRIPALTEEQRNGLTRLLNSYCFDHEVYDLLLILDNEGRVVGINAMDRYGALLPPQKLSSIRGTNISEFPAEQKIFLDSKRKISSQSGWYQSKLVQGLYDYQREDIGRQYNIALSEPIVNSESGDVVGVWINILNWSYFQNILDNVEMDLANVQLKTGYAFMLAKDADLIIAHKSRLNRKMEGDSKPVSAKPENLYGTRLIEDHGLGNLRDAVLGRESSAAFEFPKGNRQIAGITPIENRSFGWIVGVGVDNADISRPIRTMALWLFGATVFLALLVIIFTYVIAEGISGPLKNMIQTARTIARGKFDQEMVRQRTVELETSHEALKRAYVDLQNAHEQLVHTEKMASLGQLVAGIAHEIKNPLNFIYGNTSFLADYTQKMQIILESFESLQSLSNEDRAKIQQMKESANYSFIKGDLKTLIDNFAEGARRINNIVSDLRTFSRMDTEKVSEIDLHSAVEISLNLLRNQYKNRVEIHKEYGDIPRIQGYSGKISQVFMNLLSNAFHAIQDKGDVWIRTRATNGIVEVEIADNGIGIPKEHMGRIFEPFFTTKPVGQGTGLGLSISYGIIEQHHGKILVSSLPQKGSTFTIRLPIAQEG